MDTTSRIDTVEKVARLVLWLSIASACVIVPIAYIRQKSADAEAETVMREAAKKAEAKIEELENAKENAKENASKPHRLALSSIGTYLSSINYTLAQGNLWFTNVSPRSGFLCLVGIAQARAEGGGGGGSEPEVVGKTSESLPACQEISAYASTIHVPLMFAGGDLTRACPGSNCLLTFKEAPETYQ